MRRVLNWLVGVPIALIVIGFAIANRQWTLVSFDPFSRALPYASIDMPLWALLFCGLFLGALAGWIACWLAQGKWRRMAREQRGEIDRLRAAQREPAPREPVPTGHEPF